MDLNLDLIVKLIGSLTVVIALLLVTLYIMKRQGFTANETLHIQSSISIGPKERIMLIKCGEEQILIGATSSNIRTLHVLDADAQVSSEQLQVVDTADDLTGANMAEQKVSVSS